MSDDQMTAAEGSATEPTPHDVGEHFKPTGTLFVLALFVATIILLWFSVYIILLSRGVTL